MDNPETLATVDTQDTGQRLEQRGNQEWTIQRHYKTRQEKKKHNTES